jgi:MFS family permease
MEAWRNRLLTSYCISHTRLGMTAFLIPYPTGYELWAPWSEELGRWPIMQASLSLTNISILVCALATNFKTVIGGRVMGGMSSTGGSVTMGMVADIFPAEEQHFAVLWRLSSPVWVPLLVVYAVGPSSNISPLGDGTSGFNLCWDAPRNSRISSLRKKRALPFSLDVKSRSSESSVHKTASVATK